MAYLQILRGNKPSEKHQLTKELTLVGRNPDCDVWVNLGAVSRVHAHILKKDNRFYLKDLKSRNQTFINDERVDPDQPPVMLQHADRIRICDFTCIYEDPDAEAADDDGDGATVMSTIMARSSISLESQPTERLRALLDITNSLTRTLELEPLLPRILDNLFHVFRAADRGFILVRDEATKKFVAKTVKTRRPTDDATTRFSKTILKACVEEGRAILSEDASQDPQLLSASVADFKIRSVMCAPLHSAEGEPFGVIQIDTQDRSKKFTQEDLQFLVAVCNQAAVAMENAKLHEDLLLRQKLQRDVEVAKEVQQAFLPASVPEKLGYGFFAYYQAASEVGGDYYGFVPLPDGKLAIAVGDVSGKGIPAALLMARLSGDVRYALLTESDPAKVVTRLNNQFQEAGLTDRFITFSLAVLDMQTHRVEIVNAGHVPPLVRRAKTGEIEEVGAGDLNGLPLGVEADYPYQACATELEPGDCIFICSDGILDATSKSQDRFGVERLHKTLKASPAMPIEVGQRVLKAVQQHTVGSTDQFDDMTLVSFGREP